MNNNFFKATGRAAKVTGKDVSEIRKHFNKKATDAPAELVSALITAHRIYDGYKTMAVIAEPVEG